MDIPTQLAIRDADIPHLSKLVEEKIDEGRMKDIYTMDKEGKSAEEIAKALKVSVSSVKAILGEEAYDEITVICRKFQDESGATDMEVKTLLRELARIWEKDIDDDHDIDWEV